MDDVMHVEQEQEDKRKSAVRKPQTAYYVNSFITVVLMLGVGFLPAPDPITPMGMQIVGIFLGAIYGWSTIGAIWPSILTLVLLGLSGYTTVKDAFMQGFGNDTVLFIFFLFIFCCIIDVLDVTRYFAKKLISLKFTQGRPWVLAGMIFLAAYVCSALTSVVPTMIICWSIIYTLVTEMGYQKGDAFPAILLIGVVPCALISYSAMPFKLGYVVVSGLINQITGLTLDPVKYLLASLVMSILVPLCYLLVCKYILRPDVTLCRDAKPALQNNEKLSGKQKLVLTVMAIMVILMLIPSVFSGDFWLLTILNQIGMTAIVALTVALLCFLRYDGKPLINIREIMNKAIIWDVIFLLSGALVLSKALTAEATGIQEFLRVVFNPLLAGQSATIFVLLALGIALIATNFANNMVVMLILLPIMATFSATVGANMLTFAVALNCMTGMALLTPAASPFAAALHGNDWIKKKDLFRSVFILLLINYLVCVVVMVPFANLVLFR